MLAYLAAARSAVPFIVAALLVVAGGWVWIERRAAGEWSRRAAAAEQAASTARAVAVANAAAADWHRRLAADAARRMARLEAARGAVRLRTVTIVREVGHEKDALDPVGPALRLAARRLRELDAAHRAVAGADPAAPPGGSPGDPGAPAAAR